MKTNLCHVLGIEHPIIAAPDDGPDMTGPELVAAVVAATPAASASYRAQFCTPRRSSARRSAACGQLTARPFGMNLLLRFPVADQVAICLEERVPVLSLFRGDPTPYVGRAHAADRVCGAMARAGGPRPGIAPGRTAGRPDGNRRSGDAGAASYGGFPPKGEASGDIDAMDLAGRARAWAWSARDQAGRANRSRTHRGGAARSSRTAPLLGEITAGVSRRAGSHEAGSQFCIPFPERPSQAAEQSHVEETGRESRGRHRGQQRHWAGCRPALRRRGR